jgi:hypothetical protein
MNLVSRVLTAAALLFGLHSPLFAQDTVTVGVRTPAAPGEELPQEVAERIVAFYNASATIRFSGRTRIPQSRTIEGDVAILGGPVEIAGTIVGDVIVANGDVTLLASGRIEGDLTVVGGVMVGAEDGFVSGLITSWAAVFRYRRIDEGIEYIGSQPREPPPRSRTLDWPTWKLGTSEIFVSSRAYNRIEGLPVAVGPRITTSGRNPFRIDALAILRTDPLFDSDNKLDNLGYQVRLTQWLGGRRELYLGGGLQSIVSPIEDWKLANLENSLALFFFKRDYRDYYERRGWYAQFGWELNERAFFGSFRFIYEKQDSVAVGDPVTIFFNTSDPFRPNAQADAGDLQSLSLSVGNDTRNTGRRPWSGWHNQLTLEQAVGGSLSGVKPDFTHLFLDLRRYLRVSRSSVAAFRIVGGGHIAGGSTPVQRQHVIGGAGSLPGYDMFQFDCGVRRTGRLDEAYGCQRFALFQAEYRTGLNFHWHWDERSTPDEIRAAALSVDFDPHIVLFYDAGTAWDVGGYWDHLTTIDNWVADLGAGLAFGGLGFYLAYPLTGSGGVNFILRLTERF